MKCKAALGRLIVLLAAFVLMAGTAAAAGIKVVPSVERLSPGESFAVDIVAEGVPAEGLGSVQFRLHVDAGSSTVAGVADLGQGTADAVSVATPLLVSAPTAGRSGLGPFFLSGQGPAGILVLDNETLSGGSALFTYGHTKDALRSSGNGAVARFMIKVGERVEAEEVRIRLSDVLLLDGGPEYLLDYNLGATLTLRCNATVPDLAGLSLSEAEQALTGAGLVLGDVYEIDNISGGHALDVVLEQSVAAGDQTLCENGVDIAVNTAPAEMTGLSATDKADDDTGTVVLSWSASGSADVAGYRVYEGSDLLREVPNPQGSGAEIGSLTNGTAHELTVKAFDTHGNESAGAEVTVTPIDDVFPVVTISGLTEGTFYIDPVTVQASATDTNLDHWAATLNGEPFDFSVIDTDGNYILVVTAEDVSGNRTEKTVSFTVDQTGPAVIVGNLVDGRHYSSDLTPDIVIEDANLESDATTYTLDGEPYQPGTAVAAEGQHTLAVSARDKAGNSSTLELDFVIDKTAPVVAIDGVSDGTHYNVDLAPTASITDTWLKSSSITLNGSPFVSGTAITAEGECVLTVSGEDEAGNSAEQTVSFVIDKTAPLLTVEGVTDGTHYNVDLAPTASVTDTYLKSSSITLNAEAFVSGSAVMEEGEYVLALSGEDGAGNTAELTVNFVIDKTPPEIVVSGVVDGALYNVDVTPVVAITDTYLKTSGLTLDDQAFESGTVVGEEGAYALAAYGEDRAGNRSDFSLDFVIDKTAPTSTSEVGAPSYGAGEQLFIAAETGIIISSVDGGAVPSGVDRLAFTLDQTQQWADYAGSFTLADLSEGGHDIHFRCSDRAGNVEDIRTLPVILDKSAPATNVMQTGAQFTDTAGTFYVTGATEFGLSAADNLSGVARTAYRLDAAEWGDYAPFTLESLAEGHHDIGYRSVDNVDNAETEQVLAVTVDNTAPETAISVGDPQHRGDAFYVTGATEFILSATDNLSGVAATEYRIDGGAWNAYAPFTLAGVPDGEHLIEYRSTDNVVNVEVEKVLTVIVDNTAAETAISVGDLHYRGDALYVTGATEYTLSATDNLSGVAKTEYRIDGGEWIDYAPFALTGLDEGEHTIEFYSTDHVDNIEAVQSLSVVVDNTPPETSIGFAGQSFLHGDRLLVSRRTEVTLTATDNLSGVAVTHFRYDDEPGWRTYHGLFDLADLDYGTHTIHFRSIDNLQNTEANNAVEFVLSGIEVKTELLNLPRVIVWSEDPGGMKGKNKPPYTLEDIRSVVSEALDVPDVYLTMVTDKEAFKSAFRSGIYNMAFIVNHDIPFDAVFLRELREAVHRGMGLLVSSWGNNVHPVLQEVFGLDFNGSLSMEAQQRAIYLYDSPLSGERTLTASGRILKTRLDGGILAGLVPAASECNGVRSLSLSWPVELTAGDWVRASLFQQQGRKPVLIEEEQVTVDLLPRGIVNQSSGNPAGDLVLDALREDGLTFSISMPYGYLEESYTLSLVVEHADGRSTRLDSLAVTPTCSANLYEGMAVSDCTLVGLEEDRVSSGEDLPAIVLSEYGEGRTAFFAYNLIESALQDENGAHALLLRHAANHLLPEAAAAVAAGVSLLETGITARGADLHLNAVETLDPELLHLPLFDLTRQPLEYTLHINDAEETAYRYFVRFADRAGIFGKETDIRLLLESGPVTFDRYRREFDLPYDSKTLLDDILVSLYSFGETHPEYAESLDAMRQELLAADALYLLGERDLEQAIRKVVQVIHQIDDLPFGIGEVHELLGDYLRIVESVGK